MGRRWPAAGLGALSVAVHAWDLIGDWNTKVGNQETPGVIGRFYLGELSRAKANRVLPRECTGHNKHPFPTTQEKTLHMDIAR